MEPSKNELIEEIEARYGEWTDASWAHPVKRGNSTVADEHGRAIWCDGDVQCDLCDEASGDAATAEGYARGAVEALRTGRTGLALDLLERAALLERQYGDDQTWGAPAKWVERLHDAERRLAHVLAASEGPTPGEDGP